MVDRRRRRSRRADLVGGLMVAVVETAFVLAAAIVALVLAAVVLAIW